MALIITFSLLLAGLTLYQTAVVLYRLYFHPLARFPGPKLAAATGWYEAYFDLVPSPRGLFMYEITKMHQKYGPIVRVNPHEIHVKDSGWVDTLYTGPANGDVLAKNLPVFGTISHEVHRKRRAAISSIFSKAAVAVSESLIYRNIDLLLERMHSQITKAGNTEMRTNYLALATDNLADHCFGRSTGFLLDEEESIGWKKTINAVAILTPLAKQFPFLIPLALRVPIRPLQLLVPDLARIVKLRRDMDDRARSVISTFADTKSDGTASDVTMSCRKRNIFSTILANQKLDDSEKQYSRVAQEAFVALVAGGETTARAMTVATYHILANRERVLLPLQVELQKVMPEPGSRASMAELECLPWLTAVIKESLRINALVTSRLPLVSSQGPLRYMEWDIPAGTPVSMTLRDILLDPVVFHEPLEFRPERWLASNSDLQHITTNYVPFGRGSRMCLGMNLALSEMYIVLASMFRRYNFVLHETVRARDIDIVRDCFIGEVSLDSKGVRVKYAEDSD